MKYFICFLAHKVLAFLCLAGILRGEGMQVRAQGQAGSDLNLAARESFFRARTEDAGISYEERLEAYDSLVANLGRQGRLQDQLQTLLDYASVQTSLGHYTSAFSTFEQVMSRLDSVPMPDSVRLESRLRCLYGLGQVTMWIGFYPRSVQYFFDILKICGNGSDPEEAWDAAWNLDGRGSSGKSEEASVKLLTEQSPLKVNYAVRAYSNLALLFMNMDQEAQASYYSDLGRKLVQEYDSLEPKTFSLFCNNLAGWYYVQMKYDSAILIMEESEKMIANETDRAVWNYNIGNIYMGIGEMDLAKAYLNRAIEGKTSFWGYVHVISLVNLGYVYAWEKEYDEALDYYQRALDLAQQIGTRKIEVTAYVEMSGIYKAKGQYVKALELLEKGTALRDSLFGTEQQEQINLLSQEYLQKEKRLEMEMLSKQLEYAELSNRHKNMIVAILMVFLAIFCLSFCLALYNYYKERKHRKEKEQGFRQKDNQYKFDVEEKSRQLATLNLQLVQATEIIADCRSEVKKLRYSKASETKEIQQHLEEVLSAFNIDSAWDEFELCFNQIHTSFFGRLHEACPDLTRSEQRICALLVLNLSVKEIAGIIHRSVRTVEASIYQIRKKMAIPAETRTLAYLQDFLETGKEDKD